MRDTFATLGFHAPAAPAVTRWIAALDRAGQAAVRASGVHGTTLADRVAVVLVAVGGAGVAAALAFDPEQPEAAHRRRGAPCDRAGR